MKKRRPCFVMLSVLLVLAGVMAVRMKLVTGRKPVPRADRKAPAVRSDPAAIRQQEEGEKQQRREVLFEEAKTLALEAERAGKYPEAVRALRAALELKKYRGLEEKLSQLLQLLQRAELDRDRVRQKGRWLREARRRERAGSEEAALEAVRRALGYDRSLSRLASYLAWKEARWRRDRLRMATGDRIREAQCLWKRGERGKALLFLRPFREVPRIALHLGKCEQALRRNMLRVPGGPVFVDGKPVAVAAFYLDRTEVTNRAYGRHQDRTNKMPPATWREGSYPPERALCPVDGISWRAAAAYAENQGKRLPTEAEWLRAARLATRNRYPWGNEWKPGLANTLELDKKESLPAGSFLKSSGGQGIADLLGNVWEWTATSGKEEGTRLLKGGCFWAPGSKVDLDTRYFERDDGKAPLWGIGMRLAADAPGR